MAVLHEPELPPQVNVRGEPQPGFPLEPNTTARLEGRLVLWLGPDEWLVLGATEADYPDAAAAVDVSANRVAFELAGDDAPDVLAQGCSLDFDLLTEGRCAQTLLARVPVILLRGEQAWTVLVRPSLAPHLRAWVDDALIDTDRPSDDSGENPDRGP
jgi:heterotetrameric sarcosine oxidase gamma subunit